MKLYATTTSERASKGQGGNDYLNISVKDEAQNNIAELRLAVSPDNKRATLFYWDNSMSGKGFESELKLESKGKKQTTEDIEIEVSKVFFEKGKQKKGQCNHESTLSTHDGVECADCHLSQSEWNIKGKQKKGECGAIECKNPAEHTYKGIAYCDGHYTQIHATE